MKWCSDLSHPSPHCIGSSFSVQPCGEVVSGDEHEPRCRGEARERKGQPHIRKVRLDGWKRFWCDHWNIACRWNPIVQLLLLWFFGFPLGTEKGRREITCTARCRGWGRAWKVLRETFPQPGQESNRGGNKIARIDRSNLGNNSHLFTLNNWCDSHFNSFFFFFFFLFLPYPRQRAEHDAAAESQKLARELELHAR